MTNAEIFREATAAADEAVQVKYRTVSFVLGSEAQKNSSAPSMQSKTTGG